MTARDDFVNEMLQRLVDAAPQENLDTTPSATEEISLRTISVVDVYVGADLHRFLARIGSLATRESAHEISASIGSAISRDQVTVGGFSIHEVKKATTGIGDLYQVVLPKGVTVVHGWYYLLGPNSLVVIFTFVWMMTLD